MKRGLLGLVICGAVFLAVGLLTRERTLSRHVEPAPELLISAVDKTHAPNVASAPSAPTPVSAVLPTALPADFAKAQLLEQILKSKNDNDPRLDRELKFLSDGAKSIIRGQYAKFPVERRNERGTIVFLLGRNLTSESDFQFLHSVLSESPCLSLADCKTELPGSTASENLHHDSGTGVTLAYPQLVALKALESFLAGTAQNDVTTAAAVRDLEVARQSQIVRVASMADEILTKYQRTHRR